MEALQQKLETLYKLKLDIESQGFQDYIMKPIYEELNKQKNAYDCESLRELSTIKGKKQGLKFIINLLKEINVEIKNTSYELESRKE